MGAQVLPPPANGPVVVVSSYPAGNAGLLQSPPSSGFRTSAGITGITFSLICARCPKSSWLTTEYSTPSWNLIGMPPIFVVFAASSPIGTFHLFPELA
jgi:hypothetical protein